MKESSLGSSPGVRLPKARRMDDTEFRRLIERTRAGDSEARELLIRENLRLVMSIAQRFSGRGYDIDDLFQVGCIGLMKAIDRFDVAYEVRFSTYAVPLIIGEIKQHIRDSSPVKVSRGLKEIARRAERAREELVASLGREPTVAEVAGKVGASKEEIAAALCAFEPPSSLFEPVHADVSGDTVCLMDLLATEDDSSSKLDAIAIRQALAGLAPRERNVIVLRFFAGKTQAEVAGIIGVSQVHVCRLEKKALDFMKQQLA